MEKRNVILEKSFEFALEIIEFSEELENMRKYVIAKQILRSGTSVGANIREAQSCESRADFVHKLKIAAKEAEESVYWLLLCKHSKNYPYKESILQKLNEIQRLLSSIISTAKKSKTIN
ncbi:MAG: four helix bundle protein [Bacteroidales bacterium]